MKLFALALSALVLASCAIDESQPYEAFLDPNFKLKPQTAPTAPAQNPAAKPSGEPKPAIVGNRTANPSTGLRAPGDLLNLPQDDQLKSSPSANTKDGNATLIARPPE